MFSPAHRNVLTGSSNQDLQVLDQDSKDPERYEGHMILGRQAGGREALSMVMIGCQALIGRCVLGAGLAADSNQTFLPVVNLTLRPGTAQS